MIVLRRLRIPVVLAMAVALVSCAPKARPATAPLTPKFPDFVFPAVPLPADPFVITTHQAGWNLLQSGDLRAADREFTRVLRRRPGFAPAVAGLGYTALARRQHEAALQHFEKALAVAEGYAPALVGRAQALLALGRDQEALASYEAALAADPSLDLGPRIEVLRFRGAQDSVSTARAAASRGDVEAARAAYQQAITASPDSAFLHRELGIVEAKAGQTDAALEHLRRAVSLDAYDARSLVQIGDLLAGRGDFEQAARSYEAALAIEPSADVAARLTDVRRKGELAGLPPEFTAIGTAPEVTRADLAAVLGVRLADWVRVGRVRDSVLMTDTRGHWAAPWILPVVQARFMEAFSNHTFQPAARVRRADLAQSLARVLAVVAARKPGTGAAWRNARPRIADLAPSHPAYPAVAQVVAAGMMPLLPGEVFQPGRPIEGAELMAAIERLQRLAGTVPGTGRQR